MTGVQTCALPIWVCGRENSSSIPPIVENEVTIFDSKEKACIFNEYFVLQSELPVANAIPSVIQPFEGKVTGTCPFSSNQFEFSLHGPCIYIYFSHK